MLKKLLKYDFSAVIKLWSIGALAVLLLSLGGGVCLRILISDRPFHGIINLAAGLGAFGAYIAVIAFTILTFVLLAMRYYKNFFTDEGYLTFTLPVKLHSLINSKLILFMVMELLTGVVITVALLLFFAIGLESFSENFTFIFGGFGQVFGLMRDEGVLGWVILYIFEGILITVSASIFGTLFMFCCITFGAVIAKRAKVLAAIGVYYVANNIFSLVLWIFMVFGIGSYAMWLDSATLTETQACFVMALTMFGIFALQTMLCSLLYTLQYRLLDRKLNLP